MQISMITGLPIADRPCRYWRLTSVGVSIADLAPFVAPAVGAVMAYWLGRGSTVRRSRVIALEDLQIHEKVLRMLGPENPVVDQVREHARAGVLNYSSRRAVEPPRPADGHAGSPGVRSSWLPSSAVGALVQAGVADTERVVQPQDERPCGIVNEVGDGPNGPVFDMEHTGQDLGER